MEPWLPVASDDPSCTVERQRQDPDSTLAFVRALMHLRRRSPALSIGAYRSLPAPPNLFSYERAHPKEAVQVHLNFGAAAQEIELAGTGEILISTAGTDKQGPAADRIAVGPNEGLVVKTVQ